MPKRRANNEIQLARGRLLGILQDLAELDDDYDENDKVNLPLRGRPPKRVKHEKTDNLASVHESFVMKLFDRSLDLAKFQENTALYAVCRAWNINRPRESSPDHEGRNRHGEATKREKMPELVEKILKNEIGFVSAMPAPKEITDEYNESKKKKTVDEISINDSTLTQEEFLKEYKTKWKEVKDKWMERTKKRHDRYDLSFHLLNAIKEM